MDLCCIEEGYKMRIYTGFAVNEGYLGKFVFMLLSLKPLINFLFPQLSSESGVHT